MWKKMGGNWKYTWHSEKLPNGKRPHFFSSSKMQRVDEKQSKCVGVKFLIEIVLKLQNILVNKNDFLKKKKKIFKRKSLQVIYPNLYKSFREEFFCNVYFNKTVFSCHIV